MRARLAAVAFLISTSCGGGGPWQGQDVPDTFGFQGVWAFAPDDVWVGGQMMLHWDGQSWTQVDAPLGYYSDFWGFAPNDLWSVTGSAAIHWDGSAWSEVPFGALDSPDPVTVWGVSSTDLWIGGTNNSQIFHWDGTTWTRYVTQLGMVNDIWGSGPNDVYACGDFDTMWHWDGVSWSLLDVPSDLIQVKGLWGFSPNDIWAVGEFETLAHWDGAAWTNTMTDEDYSAVWGSAPDDVWAVGDGAVVSHFDGSSWSTDTLGRYDMLAGVHGSSAQDVWITGLQLRDQRGIVYHYEP